MKVIKTKIPGLLIIEPDVLSDERGFFFEGYNKERYKTHGINDIFIQDNFSSSCYGVIRGLHYQLNPYSQSKLVEVIQGKVLDVAVDLRIESPTFGQYEAVVLSEENKNQFYIPRGFAHGFSVLSDKAVFHYKCDNLYNKESEGGINYADKQLNIDWMIPTEKAIVSPKDMLLPYFNEAKMNFKF
ncbi:MAG: dTDP-4-dehydrorhamnose 3,5-epimerase [Marinilabiliaceae bacterium]|nr:dTDP-4-dehydrorhamnose 3,5-epimerase [Marinilabiliaceae bacterium]